MRINRYLAECGVASRRQCDKLIEEGAVKVNGKVCALGQDVLDGDKVTVHGKPVVRDLKKEYWKYRIQGKVLTYIRSDIIFNKVTQFGN